MQTLKLSVLTALIATGLWAQNPMARNPSVDPISLGTNYLSTTQTAATAGTTAGLLVVMDSSGNMATAGTSAVGVLGIAVSTQTTGQAVQVATRGIINGVADNTTVIGNVLIAGTSTGGRVRDSGQTDSTAICNNVQVIGKARAVATVGNAVSVQLYGPGHFGSQVCNAGIANSTIDLTAKVTGALPVVNMAASTIASGTTVSLTAPRQYYVCTGTCTVTPPVPAAGYEFCVRNANNVATVITLAAVGSSARYENTAGTAYGTAGTGTFVSGGAANDKVCIVGLDSTHYLTLSFNGTWTVN